MQKVQYDDKTPYEMVHRQPYHGEVVQFGVPVAVRFHDVDVLPREQERFEEGVLLGKRPDADEFVVATARGVVTGRTVRVLQNNPLRLDLFRQMQYERHVSEVRHEAQDVGHDEAPRSSSSMRASLG